MKKTLAAVAVLGAFAGSALAADVQLYGIVDEGFAYGHVDLDDGKDATDSFSLNSGMQSGSRFGIKGTEDLGNGLTVGFVLENGFTADDGADNDTFFDRESSLFLEGAFGKVAVGRMGSINNGTSSWAQIGVLSAFGTSSWGGYSAQIGSTASTAGLWNNMISYQTPSFAGFKVFAQYGMGNQVTKTYQKQVAVEEPGSGNIMVDESKTFGTENESSSNRYYAIGATYANGPLTAYFAVDSINYSSVTGLAAETGALQYGDVDDSLTVTLGGNYDFEVAKVFFGAQYFDEVATFGDLAKKVSFASKIKGYGLNLSAAIPMMGGKMMAGLGYVDAEDVDNSNNELQRYVVSVGYDYAFSKRTDVYAAANYMQDSIDKGADSMDPYAFTVGVGLRHKF